MPDVFLGSGGAVSVGDQARVFGRAGDGERVFLDAATTDVWLDANIERVDLERGLDTLSLRVGDDGLRIIADGEIVATLPSLNQPMDLVGRDGRVTLRQTGPATFDAVGSAGEVATIDRGIPASLTVTPEPGAAMPPPIPESPAAAVFLEPGEALRAREPVEVFGHASGGTTLALAEDARGIRGDANLTRLELPYAVDAVDMRVMDDGLAIRQAGAARVTLPSLNQTLDAVFTDGRLQITQVGPARFDVTGAETTVALDRDGLAGDVVPAAAPDADGPPMVQVADARAVEGGALAFDVTTTNVAQGTMLAYTITPGSAGASDLRAPLTGNLTIDSANGTATLMLGTADDAAVEPATETLTLTLTDPDSGASATATGIIRDNDDAEPPDASRPVPALDVAAASAREGGTLRFAVTSSDLPQGAEIDWRLDLTGAGESDIAGATAGTVALDAGRATIAVDTADDTAIETGGPETFELIATNRATGARATATGEIVDNDGPGGRDSVTVTAPTTTEGGELTFAVIAPAPADGDRSFPWELDLDGTPPSLVTGETSGTVTIPAGATRAEVAVATVDDSTARNAPDTVTFTLGDGAGTVLASATGTIRDDDPAIPPDVPVLTLGDATATEGETLAIPFALSKPAPADTAIVGGLDSDRAGPGVDADDFPGDQVSDVVALAEGETNGVLRLPVADDDAVEGTETFGVSASSPDLAETDVRFGEATILDNDGPAAAQFAGRTDAVEPMAL